jgi:hypothetical protein
MKTTYIDAKRKALVEKREILIGRFGEAVRARKDTACLTTAIRRTNDFLESLEQIVDENTRKPGERRRYAVSSLFLHECALKLTADADEQFFFVTGPEVDGAHVLDQCAEFAHQRRTRLGVVADMPSTHNLLIRLEEFGHKFLAHFHSHPGNGPGATHPSGTDETFQRQLEKGGHLALMAIFSRDGYIRFVRLDQNFELEIYGEGVENYAPGIYRLTKID